MNFTLPCPEGYYCLPETRDNGIPCPLGTFSNVTGLFNESQCQACLAGMHCNETGLSWPTGFCEAGFLCISGAMESAPDDGINGPCPAGAYCEEGVTSEALCPPGTFNPTRGGHNISDCLPCTGGKYCGTSGLSTPSGWCLERYYCPSDAEVSDNRPSEFECPAGHYCLNDTATPYACEPGTYQPSTASIDCLVCPERYYCLVNSSHPEPCSPYSYCPEGSPAPISCPNGTYTMDNVTGLASANECQLCPTGSYCLGGRVAGPCAAGYLCYSGSDTPTPDGNDPTVGEICPFGFYCEEGAANVSACEPGKVIAYEGAKSALECQQCPAGYICSVDNVLPQPCTPGYYCEFDADRTPCPNTTYSSESGATNSSTCQPCPAGYWCNELALTNYTKVPCPLGHYCPTATEEPLPCPPGTYRSELSAEDEMDCTICPAGYYCPNDTANIFEIECDEGQFCPEGSWDQRDCQPGYYCNRSMTQEKCPAGYYCPVRSPYPIQCPDGHYCGEECGYLNDTSPCPGSITPVICPLGYREKEGSRRSTFENTCEICPAGYYGNMPDRANCTICAAGVVCLEGATTDYPLDNTTMHGVNFTNSFPCPVGYYCPEGSAAATPCPVGTYRSSEYAMALSDCLVCGVDHFNHLTGQQGCFHCGGQATTEGAVGSSECTCNGANQEFQFTDRKCICQHGYALKADGNTETCTKTVYEQCDEGTYRNQQGQCWTEAEWEDYCRNQQCQSPEDYIGFIKGNPNDCQCKTEDLEVICNRECQVAQENRITLVCSDPAYVKITDANGNETMFAADSLSKIINSRNALTTDQCTSLDGHTQKINLIITYDAGFTGAYDPDPDDLTALLLDNSKDGPVNSSILVTNRRRRRSVEWGINGTRMDGRRRLMATVEDPSGGTYTGISNPTVCLKYGETMLFTVDNNNYPVYDRENLYNTNEKFDYGGFRELAEQQSQVQTSTTLFAYQFVDPGVYVFTLSNNTAKKMYIRVMAENAQCSEEGPFFPSTPRYIIQNGIALESGILLAPDWITIGLVLGLSVVLSILLIIALMLFRKYGWNKQRYVRPKFRNLTAQNNLDDLASKGSTVHHVKKYHRALEGRNMETEEGAGVPVEAIEVKSDDFWDYDKQVDLEGFTTTDFYDHLSRQSRHVTSELGRQKDEAKALYQQLANQAQSLKGLWVAKLNLKGKAALATEADLAAYDSKKEELELELERRRELGMRMEAYLKRQADILKDDERYREEHQVSFLSGLSEATRLMNEYAEKLSAGGESLEREFDNSMQNHTIRRVGALLSRMSQEVSGECQRVGAWGVLGQGSGGLLVAPGTDATPLPQEELFGADGKLQQTEVTQRDPTTGLVVPVPGSMMLTASGEVRSVSVNMFVHPQTGHVLPMNGNVSYDTMTSRLIVITDTSSPELPRSDEGILPYVPFPIDSNTGAPVQSLITEAEHSGDIKLGAPMSDPVTGLQCPILAITIHPETGVAYPLCGTHVDPVTGLPLPIEVGSLMIDPTSDQPVPILDVAIDSETGEVIPIGGVRQSQTDAHDAYSPMVMSDKFVEPVSMLTARIGGSRLEGTEVVPTGGSYQSLLDASLMSCEIRVMERMKTYLDNLMGPDGGNCRHEQNLLETAVKDMTSVRQRSRTQLIRDTLDVERRAERANILAVSGGTPGMYEFAETGQLLPILVGTLMSDPAGSGQKVPILGVGKNPESGRLMPLGGTMEDHEGDGLVPIMIGHKAVDPVTGDLSPVTGVRINTENGTVVPVTLSGGAKKAKPPLGAVSMIEDELVARRGFWRRQRQREDEMISVESHLTQQLILEIENLAPHKVEEALETLAEQAKTIEDYQRREVERRTESTEELDNILPSFIMAILSQGDEPERIAAEKHNVAHTKYNDTVRKFHNRLQAEEAKYKERMDELQDALNPDAEAGALHRYRQAKARLLSDLKDQLMSRTENIDEDRASMEYGRERSELLTLEAKALLTNAIYIAGTYDATITGVYGDTTTTEQSSREVIPLLKQLIAMLERGSTFTLSAELIQGLQGGGSTSVTVGGANSIINRSIAQGANYGVNITQQQGYVPPGQPGGKTTVNLLQAAATDSRPQTAAVSSHDIKSKLVVQDTLQSLTEESKTEMAKTLVERQTLECVKLEEELRGEEIKAINGIIQSHEEQKEEKIRVMKEELRARLKEAKTEQEKEKLVEDFVLQSAKVSSSIEADKQKQLENLRKKLGEKRSRKKKELHSKHLLEAKQEGLSEDIVPEMTEEDEDHQAKLQRLLMLQQNKLIAQLQQAYLEDDLEMEEKRNSGFDEDMEERMRKFNLSNRPKMAAIIDDIQSQSSTNKKTNSNMKDKMKNRMKGRRAAKSAKDILPSGLDPESTIAMEFLAADAAQEDTDGTRGISAAMEVLSDVEKEKQLKEVEQVIQQILAEEAEELTTEEKEKLLEEYKEILDSTKEKMDESKQEQRDHLMAKLAARKRLKEEVLKEESVAKELEHLSKQQVLRGNNEGQDALADVHDRANDDDAAFQKNKLLENQQHRAEALELSQQTELKRSTKELEEEKARLEGSVSNQLEEQKEEVLARKQQAFEKEMLLKGKQLNKDQSKEMIEKHQKEMEALSQSMDEEKNRQRAAIAERIAKRKQQKEESLKQMHAAEMKQELLKQRAERDELADKQHKNVERDALVDALNADRTSKAENVIYRVLRQRHIKEQVHQEEQMEQEKEVEMARIKAKATEQLQKDRDALVEAQQKEFLELVANSGSMSPGELEDKKEALQRQHKKQLAEFDRASGQKIEQAMRDCLPALEVKQAQARLALREKQLQELAEAMRDLSPEEALVQQYTELAEKAAADAQKFRETKVAEMQAELDCIKADKKRRDDARKAKMEQEVAALEAELENDKIREEERERKRQLEKQRAKEQQKEEAERRLQQELKHSEGNEAAKEKLLQEHKENMKRFEENFQKDQQRNADRTKARLEARKKKKQEQEMARIQGDIKNQSEIDERRTLDQMNLIQQKGASELNQTSVNAWRPETPGDWAQRKEDGLDERPDLPEGVNQAMYSALMASPFFTDLKEIEEMLKDTLGFKDGVKGAVNDAFIDLKDAQWILGREITPLDIDSISPSQFVVYRFGVFVTRLLRLTLRMPDVTLLLASSLPQNDYKRNMFRHSFFYQHAKKILFVRHERLDSVGEFVMVIVHCLAHIKVNDLTDDSNPYFLREFFKGMKMICQDMFFSRAKVTQGARALVGGMMPKGKRPLEAIFKQGKGGNEKAAVVTELIDTRVKHTDKEDFTKENIKERITDEQEESSKARLREYMVTHGGFKSTSDFVETRLKELRGTKTQGDDGAKPTIQITSSSTLRSQRELIDLQIHQTNTQLDQLNSQLAKSLTDLQAAREGIRRAEEEPQAAGDGEKSAEVLRMQASALDMKITNLTKKIDQVEAELTKKRKEREAAS